MRPLPIILTLALTSLVFTGTAAAQTDVAAILRAPAERVSAQELPVGYRALTLGTGAGTFNSLALFGFGSSSSNDDKESMLVFSCIDSIFVDPDAFARLLDGKETRIKGYAFDFLGSVSGEDFDGAPAPVFKPMWIEGGRLLSWQPKNEITREKLIAAFPDLDAMPRLAGVKKTLNAVYIATKMFAADHKGAVPRSLSDVRPYVAKGIDLNGLIGATVNGGGGFSMVGKSKAPLFAESKPGPEGRRGLLRGDGTVIFVKESSWANRYEMQFAKPPLPQVVKPAGGTKGKGY